MKQTFTLCLMLLVTSCGSTEEFTSRDHDFSAAVLEQQEAAIQSRSRLRRPDLDKLLAAAKKRFSRQQELKGLLDEAATRALAPFPWTEHPELRKRRNELKAALDEYDQARELEDLLTTYRSFHTPGKPEPAVIAPHIESIRGTMADLRAESAWFNLRKSLVDRAALIFSRQAKHTYLEAELTANAYHLKLIDELIPVVRARTGTGRSRQADFLTVRSERSTFAARVEAIQARLKSTAHDLMEATNSNKPVSLAAPRWPGVLADAETLAREALLHEPGLNAMRALLERRRQGLRLANLKASEKPAMPGGGVRAAVRREMQNRIDALEEEIRRRELKITTDVSSAHASLLAARAQATALRESSVPDARKSLNDLRASYSGRRATFLDVFRAARRRLDVELALVRAERDQTLAEAALLRALGRRIR